MNKGIRLNSNYNDKGDKKTVTNLIFEEIKDVLDDRMKPRNGTKEYIGNDKASDIISDLLLAGGKAKEFFRNNLAQRYSSNDFNDLDKKYKEIKSKLKGIAYESIVKKSTQTQDGLEVGIDNGHFCIEYPQDSIIEPVKILNNEKAKELKLKVCTLKIVESIVRVERVNGKRNYTDILGSIKMSFTTEAGEISIYLHPSEKDSNKIEVEIDKESEARLNKLKAEKKSLGENCLLGGKSVLEAIEDKGFKKNGSVFTESTETTKVIHLLILRKLICGVRKKIPLGGISHSVKILRN
ncbi:hypothetical protein [Wolbachia endosymbiont of Oedothorax gibbosus]|uniref:hypothetical protein n=1 Tax=Wolbachia endosymbiont of Oedothorax gibbosus TaxID=931100 RepID=UPI002023DA4F|nr:hypothetical protein [Wolbachia endosymbiont of Oedothorax gibbosus]